MPALWFVPAAITLAGAVLLWIALTRVASAAGDLQRSVREWDGLRPAVVEVRSETDALRARLEQLRTSRER